MQYNPGRKADHGDGLITCARQIPAHARRPRRAGPSRAHGDATPTSLAQPSAAHAARAANGNLTPAAPSRRVPGRAPLPYRADVTRVRVRRRGGQAGVLAGGGGCFE